MIDNLRVQKRIFDLYGEKEYTPQEVKDILEKYKEQAKMWEDGLKSYNTEDVLMAIDEYWRFKDSEKKPRLAHIQAMLNTTKSDDYCVKNTEEQEKFAHLAEKTKEELRKKMLEKWG